MSKQIVRLCRLQLGNLFGINELRHTKDKAKKGRFAMKGYEMLISLPVSRAAIIISRFVCMYLTNLIAGLLIMLPGLVTYGCMVRPAVGFYVLFIIGSLFLPLLPLTVSSILGAVITAISSRSRHRSLMETILMLLFVIAVLAGSLFFPGKESQMTKEMLQNMAGVLSDQIGKMYPPSVWFGKALSGDWAAFGLLLFVPTVIFSIFVAILQRYFQRICAAIHAVSAKNNYKMTTLQRSSHVTALWRKELKRYFASSVYVTNTLVGYVMAVLVAAAALIMGMDKIVAALGIPDVGPVIVRCLPYGLSCLLCMTCITACSISMEGNNFWQIQTLPVTTKEVFDSKILANLSVAATLVLYRRNNRVTLMTIHEK